MIEVNLASGHPQSAVLLVDDDATWQDACARFLRPYGFEVTAARTADDALAACRSNAYTLMLTELQLPDSDAIDVVRRMKEAQIRLPFAVLTKHATVQTAVSAMRLGAIDFVEKPIDMDDLLVRVRQWTGGPAAAHRPDAPRRLSVAERWATYVIRMLESDADLKTITDWARFVGVSRTTLCETCRLVHTESHMARDFARMLRVLVKSPQDRLQLGALLDVADARTLKRLLERSGFELGARDNRRVPSIDQFLTRQQFIPPDSEGMTVVEQMLERLRDRADRAPQ
jgi:DNA-binding response OmpR family regulator